MTVFWLPHLLGRLAVSVWMLKWYAEADYSTHADMMAQLQHDLVFMYLVVLILLFLSFLLYCFSSNRLQSLSSKWHSVECASYVLHRAGNLTDKQCQCTAHLILLILLHIIIGVYIIHVLLTGQVNTVNNITSPRFSRSKHTKPWCLLMLYYVYLFHDLLLWPCLYHCFWCEITGRISLQAVVMDNCHKHVCMYIFAWCSLNHSCHEWTCLRQ